MNLDKHFKCFLKALTASNFSRCLIELRPLLSHFEQSNSWIGSPVEIARFRAHRKHTLPKLLQQNRQSLRRFQAALPLAAHLFRKLLLDYCTKKVREVQQTEYSAPHARIHEDYALVAEQRGYWRTLWLAETDGSSVGLFPLNASFLGDDQSPRIEAHPPQLIELCYLLDDLEKHDPITCTALEMMYFGGFTKPEILETCGLTDNEFKNRKRKAFTYLRRRLLKGLMTNLHRAHPCDFDKFKELESQWAQQKNAYKKQSQYDKKESLPWPNLKNEQNDDPTMTAVYPLIQKACMPYQNDLTLKQNGEEAQDHAQDIAMELFKKGLIKGKDPDAIAALIRCIIKKRLIDKRRYQEAQKRAVSTVSLDSLREMME